MLKLNSHMRKKECIRLLNEMLATLQDHQCFDAMMRQLNIDDQELEILLNSVILDIDNDDCR